MNFATPSNSINVKLISGKDITIVTHHKNSYKVKSETDINNLEIAKLTSQLTKSQSQLTESQSQLQSQLQLQKEEFELKKKK